MRPKVKYKNECTQQQQPDKNAEQPQFSETEQEELKEFKLRLQATNVSVKKVKPNLSQSWLQALKSRLHEMC